MKSNSTYLLLAILLLTSSCVIGADWRVWTVTDTSNVLRSESVWAAAGTNPHTWQRWEHALTSTRNYGNSYAELTLRAIYTGPAGQTIRAYGFWDGGDTFRIRCAFPTSGTWRWETECSDAADTGLHKQGGTVEVAPYRGDGLLYRHGFLKVSDNRRYLAYNDNTPFLWIGDTAWAVPQKASDEEWEAYIADRTGKHFTLLQVAPAPKWAGDHDRRGQRPFTDESCSQWNPAYWQSFEQKVQRANEAGLVVLLVGLMEPAASWRGFLATSSSFLPASTASSCPWPMRWAGPPARPRLCT